MGQGGHGSATAQVKGVAYHVFFDRAGAAGFDHFETFGRERERV
jgi:hypothetical protein